MSSKPQKLTLSAEETELIHDAESVLLGAVLIEDSRKVLDEVSAIINSDDFLNPVNRTIFSAMQTCGEKPNQIVVAQEIFKITNREHCFATTMSQAIYLCPCSLDYLVYAKVVKNYSNIRNGITNNKPRYYGGI